jgi:hypothetical protein
LYLSTLTIFDTLKILGFSNGPSWLIGYFLLMDMSTLTRGSKHIFWPINLTKVNNLTNTSSQVGQP